MKYNKDAAKGNKLTTKQIIISIISGIVVGFINGFFGGGGGMIVVPMLVFLLGLEDKNAHATALFVILPISIASSVVYILNNSLEYNKLLFCGIGAVIGGIIGAILLNKINNKILRVLFSLIMIGAGIKMIV